MSLENRIRAFDVLCSRVRGERPARLLVTHRVPEEEFEALRLATAVYLSKCLGSRRPILDEADLMATLERRRHEVPNITPNGMIVPKRHTILEYNALVRAFANILSRLEIDDLVLSWHVPLNLRVKFAQADADNLKRHHPTEHIHSDSWAGESSESVTTHLPIFGDTARNHVVFYDPPEDFQEEWLGPRPTYQDGATIADRYRKVDFVASKGQLVFADFAGLHASSRLPNAGTRVTIDTTFALRRLSSQDRERIHPWRENERAPHRVLANLGETHLFVFPDDARQQVDSQGGFKHPTNLRIIEILPSAK